MNCLAHIFVTSTGGAFVLLSIMPEVAIPPDSYRLDVSKMGYMNLFIGVCVCPLPSRALQQ